MSLARAKIQQRVVLGQSLGKGLRVPIHLGEVIVEDQSLGSGFIAMSRLSSRHQSSGEQPAFIVHERAVMTARSERVLFKPACSEAWYAICVGTG